jgi:hypothetical protein
VLRRAVILVFAALAGLVLTACQLDVDVELRVGPAGTGEVVVTATADADVVSRAPGLAEDLRFDDAVAAGWTVEGPVPTETGGLTVTLRHPVSSAAEATTLLNSLGAPFSGVTLTRTAAADDEQDVTVSLTGQLQLAGGFEAFADSELLAAVGGLPFEDDLTTAGASPAESMSVRLRADLPGEVVETTGSPEDGMLRWDAPLDGSALDLTTRTVQSPSGGGSWARPLSWIALVALVAWAITATAGIVYVARARRARAARGRTALR